MGEPHDTAARDLLPFHQKLAYGAGAFINNTLAAAIGANSRLMLAPASVPLSVESQRFLARYTRATPPGRREETDLPPATD